MQVETHGLAATSKRHTSGIGDNLPTCMYTCLCCGVSFYLEVCCLLCDRSWTVYEICAVSAAMEWAVMQQLCSHGTKTSTLLLRDIRQSRQMISEGANTERKCG